MQLLLDCCVDNIFGNIEKGKIVNEMIDYNQAIKDYKKSREENNERIL